MMMNISEIVSMIVVSVDLNGMCWFLLMMLLNIRVLMSLRLLWFLLMIYIRLKVCSDLIVVIMSMMMLIGCSIGKIMLKNVWVCDVLLIVVVLCRDGLMFFSFVRYNSMM